MKVGNETPSLSCLQTIVFLLILWFTLTVSSTSLVLWFEGGWRWDKSAIENIELPMEARVPEGRLLLWKDLVLHVALPCTGTAGGDWDWRNALWVVLTSDTVLCSLVSVIDQLGAPLFGFWKAYSRTFLKCVRGLTEICLFFSLWFLEAGRVRRPSMA